MAVFERGDIVIVDLEPVVGNKIDTKLANPSSIGADYKRFLSLG